LHFSYFGVVTTEIDAEEPETGMPRLRIKKSIEWIAVALA
jgi:hypothetical protein